MASPETYVHDLGTARDAIRQDLRFLLINPVIAVAGTVISGYLIWYFMMPRLVVTFGLAARHDTPSALSNFFILFLSFVLGMAFGNQRYRPGDREIVITDAEWLRIAVAATLITLVGEAVFLRPLLNNPASFIRSSLSQTFEIAGFEVRQNQILGLSSLDNLFPVPAAVAAMLVFSKRKLNPAHRRSAALLLAFMGVMAFIHAVLVLARIWLLLYAVICLVAWIVQRRPTLGTQLRIMGAGLLAAVVFVLANELIRSLGMQLASAGLNITDPRVLTFFAVRMVQAYPASDINNALIVLDCEPAKQLVSTIDVAARLAETLMGGNFVSYQVCPGYTSLVGTINFLALIWWDWGYWAIPVLFAIGFWIETNFRAAIRESQNLSVSAVLLPSTVFAGLLLTRAFSLGQTLYLFPAGFLAAIWFLVRLGGLHRSPPLVFGEK